MSHPRRTSMGVCDSASPPAHAVALAVRENEAKIPPSEDPRQMKGLCLLSLDGGGVRGLSTLLILDYLMRRVNEGRSPAEQRKPHEIFDMIGGTSTGGLIAIMLGHLKMDVSECIEAYTALFEKIFGKKVHKLPVTLNGKVRSMFDSVRLKQAIVEMVEKHGYFAQDLFNDGEARGCRTFVCATSVETGDTVHIRNYHLVNERQMKATIVDAALATSAATTFFDEVEINGEKFCDGAFGANNPVDQVYIEASSIWDDMGGQLSSALKCFISIGTGVPGVDAMREDVAGFLSKTLKAMVTETERTQQRFMKRNKDVAKPDGKQRFFRFNVEQGLQGVGLAEYLRQGSIKAATNRYMESLQQITLVRLCSEHLRQKQLHAPPNLIQDVQKFQEESAKKNALPLSSSIQDFSFSKEIGLDPITVLSLSGTIIQFVDLGTKLLEGKAVVTHQDGKMFVEEEIGFAVKNIRASIAKLQRPLDVKEGKSTWPGTVALERLSQRSTSVGTTLILSMENARKRKDYNMGKTLQQSSSSIWKTSEAKTLRGELLGIQESLNSNVLEDFQNRINLDSIRDSANFQKLDQPTKNIIASLLGNRGVSANELYEQIRAVTQLLNRTEIVVNEYNKSQATIIEVIRQAVAPVPIAEPASILHNLQRALPTLPSIRDRFFGSKMATQQRESRPEADVQREKRAAEEERIVRAVDGDILRCLRYPHMSYRYEEVDKAHIETFDWVFEDHFDVEYPWSTFPSWMRSGSGIYWISGKPGSGKSTLMRHIYDNPQTDKLLKVWAGDEQFIIAGFFFWNSGTIEQRSQLGLFRTLLYTILKQRSELIPVVFPWLWAQRYSERVRADIPDDFVPTLPKLLEAFKLLMEQTAICLKICLFIDGLDEYEGDFPALAELLKSIAISENFKVCLSSRPLLAFQDAFSESPSFRLQDLTYGDIRKYVGDGLNGSSRFRLLSEEKAETALALVEEIVEKADGVFLWVKLVIDSLLEGFTNRDGLKDLQRRLDDLPRDLEKLYNHMLRTRIDPFYAAKISELLQILRKARSVCSIPLTVLGLSFADDDDAEFAINAEVEPLRDIEIRRRCDEMAARLNSRSAGLLEVKTARRGILHRDDPTNIGNVAYMHRTARDFLEQPGIWKVLVSRTEGTGFNPDRSLLQSYILQLKTCPEFDMSVISRAEDSRWHFLTAALEHARAWDAETASPSRELLEQLDRAMIIQVKRIIPDQVKHWATYQSGGFGEKPEWQDNFLSLMVQYNLRSYVNETLELYPKLMQGKRGRPLLHYVLETENAKQVTYGQNLEMATLLLDNGANPNEEYRSETLWKHEMWSFYKGWPKTSFVRQIPLLKALVNSGADPNAIWTIPDSKTGKGTSRSVLWLLSQVEKKEWNLEELHELENMLIERGARSKDGPQEKKGSIFKRIGHRMRS